MSYAFKLSGVNKAMVKAAVQAQSAPQELKDRICAQVDAVVLAKLSSGEPSQIILVVASGHMQEPVPSPAYGETVEKSYVHVVEFHGAVPKAEAPKVGPIETVAAEAAAPAGAQEA